jgi:hypothetical protein
MVRWELTLCNLQRANLSKEWGKKERERERERESGMYIFFCKKDTLYWDRWEPNLSYNKKNFELFEGVSECVGRMQLINEILSLFYLSFPMTFFRL